MNHQTLGVITEMNVAIDGNEDGWVRVNMIDDDGNSTSALIEKDVAENAAIEMSNNIVNKEWVQEELDNL